jgi:hypothetical protein
MNGYEIGGEDCEKCRLDCFMLIEHLIFDIQNLASEVVRLRHLLSWHLPEDLGETIRGESLSDLYGSYCDHDTYRDFVSKYRDGEDPLESERYVEHMRKLAHGEDSNEFRCLTF